MKSNVLKYPLLLTLKKKLEWPMLFLSFVWLCIIITELVHGSSPVLSDLGTGIWILFIFYFLMRMLAVANRIAFLKKNWLFILAIFVSALRFFPFLQPFPLVRALTATFGMQVIWIFVSADQGLRILRSALGHRGAGYALALTFVGSALISNKVFHLAGRHYVWLYMRKLFVFVRAFRKLFNCYLTTFKLLLEAVYLYFLLAIRLLKIRVLSLKCRYLLFKIGNFSIR